MIDRGTAGEEEEEDDEDEGEEEEAEDEEAAGCCTTEGKGEMEARGRGGDGVLGLKFNFRVSEGGLASFVRSTTTRGNAIKSVKAGYNVWKSS